MGSHGVRARVAFTSSTAQERTILAAPGSRSPIYVFESVEGQEPVTLGAVIEDVTQAGAEIDLVLEFWAEPAAIYATPGTSFGIWYRETVGSGVVVELV